MGLPRPTTDLDQLKADLDEHGYCIVADALSPDEVTRCELASPNRPQQSERALDYHYQAEAEGDDVNQWVYQLINKGEEFQNLALHPTARALATHILGAEHILSSLDAHITHPGNKTMPLHADQWWMPQPVAPGTPHGRQGDMTRETGPFGEPTRATVPINPPLVANMMWMANDFTSRTGPPASCRAATSADACPIRSGRTMAKFHRGASRLGAGLGGPYLACRRSQHCRSSPLRRGHLLLRTDHPLTRQSHLRHAHRGARVDESELATLCGFTPWSSYGMTDHPSAMVASPGDETAGRLS